MKKERTPLSARLAANGKKFTASDTVIGNYLLQHYPRSLLQNASEVASALGLNITTVTRFFAKLGYKSSKEAFADFREELEFVVDAPIDRYNAIYGMSELEESEFNSIIEIEHKNINDTLLPINMDNLRKVAKALGKQGRKVFIIGTMKEFAMAYYLYVQLFAVKEEVFLYQNSLANFLVGMDKNSICVFFDFRRNTNLNKKIVEYAKKCEATVVSVSDSKFSPTALLSDFQFTVAAKSTTMFDSYTAGLALIDVLMALVVDTHGDAMKTRYNKMEEIYKHFEIFIPFKP